MREGLGKISTLFCKFLKASLLCKSTNGGEIEQNKAKHNLFALLHGNFIPKSKLFLSFRNEIKILQPRMDTYIIRHLSRTLFLY